MLRGSRANHESNADEAWKVTLHLAWGKVWVQLVLDPCFRKDSCKFLMLPEAIFLVEYAGLSWLEQVACASWYVVYAGS